MIDVRALAAHLPSTAPVRMLAARGLLTAAKTIAPTSIRTIGRDRETGTVGALVVGVATEPEGLARTYVAGAEGIIRAMNRPEGLDEDYLEDDGVPW